MATVEEIPPGSRKIVEVVGRSIGVFNVDGRFYALRNRCPHQGGPLCLGPALPFLDSAGPGSFVVDDGRVLVQCPWHAWEFDLATGQSWFDPDGTRVRAYPVTIERGGGLEPGPYRAETYPVLVEQANVVVELPGRQRRSA